MQWRKFWLPAAGMIAISLFIFISCDTNLHRGTYFVQPAPSGPPIGKASSINENPFVKTSDSATSTFSIDADGASYATARRLVISGQINSYKNALRSEELINYFTYNYPDPTDNTPIAVNGEVSSCPWNTEHKLIRIGIKGKSIQPKEYPLANFVLLIDVSGSMASDDKLKLLKDGFKAFVGQMRPRDQLAIVTYAGFETLALESTPGTEKKKILA